MSYTEITYAVADRIATLTLDRPEARNGYTETMADELAAALRAADADSDVRVVVLTAAGKDFCVGMDLSSGTFGGSAPDSAYVEPATRVTSVLDALDKPVIAAVHGAAVGVGSTMILPADYRLASEDARFGFVFSRRGIFPEGGSTWFLPRIVGLGHATDWMISGRIIPAAEAHAAGLVHQVHPAEALLDNAYRLARDLRDNTAPVSTAVIRRALLHHSGSPSPATAFAVDSQLIAGCTSSPDAAEGVRSFLERRPPAFPGIVPDDVPGYLPWLHPEPSA